MRKKRRSLSFSYVVSPRILLGACPRCSGDIIPHYGYSSCLLCGYQPSAKDKPNAIDLLLRTAV